MGSREWGVGIGNGTLSPTPYSPLPTPFLPQSAIRSLQPGFLHRPPPGKLNYCQTNLATRAPNLWVFP